MDRTDPPLVPKASARRRLIRGALSAPALMTVCSGSAFAVASNMRCLANANTLPAPAPWGTTTPDTYLRVQLYKVTTCVPPSQRDDALKGGGAAETETKPTVLTEVNTAADANTAKPKKPGGIAPANFCNDVDTYYIKGSDLSAYTVGGGMPSPSQYLQINNVTYQTIGSPVSPPVAPPAIVNQAYVNQYVAVRFNTSGTLVGIGDAGSGGQGGMVGTSCWASAFPRP